MWKRAELDRMSPNETQVTAIVLEDGCLVYRQECGPDISKSLAELAVILEYSLPPTESRWGHYFVLVFRDLQFIEWPSDAVYSRQLIDALEQHLSRRLCAKLSSSNEPASRIIWPLELRDLEGLRFVIHNTTPVDWVRNLLSVPRITIFLSDATIAEASAGKRPL